MNTIPWYYLQIQFIYIGAGLSLLIAILQWLKYREETAINKLALTCLIAFTLLIRMGLYASNRHNHYYLLMIPGIASGILLAGPLALAQLRRMLEFCFPAQKVPFYLQALPAMIVFSLELAAIITGEDFSRRLVSDTFDKKLGIGFYILIFAILHLCSNFLLVLFKLSALRFQYSIRYGQLLFYLLFVPVTGFIAVTLGFIFDINSIFVFGLEMVSLTMIIIISLMVIYPGFFGHLEEQIRERYSTTPLTGIDINQVEIRLVELMSSQQVYKDADIRLTIVADKLNISSNQLSRILNEVFTMSFNEFINRYRVQEAKQQLESSNKGSVLEIAYRVGFNSKSTFNKQFKKDTGMTPIEYRENFHR